MLNRNKVGLALGTFAAIAHAVWSFGIAIFPSGIERFVNWIYHMHFLSLPIKFLPFSLGKAALLVVMSFVVAYVVGSVFATVYNWIVKK